MSDSLGQKGGAGLLALAAAGLSASGSWARRAGGKGSGEVWATGEKGAGPRGLLGQERRGKAGPVWEKGWAGVWAGWAGWLLGLG